MYVIVLTSILFCLCIRDMARTNLKYVRQSGLGKGKDMEQMKRMSYKEINDCDEDKKTETSWDEDEDDDDVGLSFVSGEEYKYKEGNRENGFDQLKLPQQEIQESVHRFLILRKKNEQYAKRDRVYTKSPCDIKVSVNSKYQEIKCVCELKYEAYEELNKLTKLYRHWKNRYEQLDLIETRYLTKIVGCQRKRKFFADRRRLLKKKCKQS